MREAGEFVLTLFHAATNTHILHLRSRSFAEHSALGEFYQALPDLTDKLAEAIQGRQQELLDFPAAYYEPADTGLDELTQLQDYVEQERRLVLPDASEIQNIVDEIAELIDSTIYKLKFLK
jgi:DNA-binding ferritin-like protein